MKYYYKKSVTYLLYRINPDGIVTCYGQSGWLNSGTRAYQVRSMLNEITREEAAKICPNLP